MSTESEPIKQSEEKKNILKRFFSKENIRKNKPAINIAIMCAIISGVISLVTSLITMHGVISSSYAQVTVAIINAEAAKTHDAFTVLVPIYFTETEEAKLISTTMPTIATTIPTVTPVLTNTPPFAETLTTNPLDPSHDCDFKNLQLPCTFTNQTKTNLSYLNVSEDILGHNNFGLVHIIAELNRDSSGCLRQYVSPNSRVIIPPILLSGNTVVRDTNYYIYYFNTYNKYKYSTGDEISGCDNLPCIFIPTEYTSWNTIINKVYKITNNVDIDNYIVNLRVENETYLSKDETYRVYPVDGVDKGQVVILPDINMFTVCKNNQ